MKPNWGPHLWKSIHYIALGYPENPSIQDKENYKNFFYILRYIIPCKYCRDHYEKNINDLPNIDLYLDTNIRLFEWTVLLHNKVNLMLNKKEMTLKDAYNLYTKNNNNIYLIIGIILCIIILFLIIFKK